MARVHGLSDNASILSRARVRSGHPGRVACFQARSPKSNSYCIQLRLFPDMTPAAQAVLTMRSRALHSPAAALTLLAAFTLVTHAQSLPPPAKTVFKCEENGKVVYSDSPCLGAKTVDVEPPRGVSRLSGKERVGSAVQQERLREHIADAMRPLTGMNPKQYETFGRRQKLPADAQRECQRLDGRIPLVEAEERQASGQGLADIQLRLLGLRKRFRELAC